MEYNLTEKIQPFCCQEEDEPILKSEYIFWELVYFNKAQGSLVL